MSDGGTLYKLKSMILTFQ